MRLTKLKGSCCIETTIVCRIVPNPTQKNGPRINPNPKSCSSHSKILCSIGIVTDICDVYADAVVKLAPVMPAKIRPITNHPSWVQMLLSNSLFQNQSENNNAGRLPETILKLPIIGKIKTELQQKQTINIHHIYSLHWWKCAWFLQKFGITGMMIPNPITSMSSVTNIKPTAALLFLDIYWLKFRSKVKQTLI